MSGPPAGTVDVLLVCSPARAAALTATLRTVPELRLAEVVTMPARAPRAAVELGRGVLLLDAGVDGGAAALVHAVMRSAPLPILVLGPALAAPEVAALLAAGAVEVRTREGAGGLAERCKVLAGVGVVRRTGPRLPPEPVPGRGAGTVVAVGASTGGPQAVAALLGGLAGLAVPVLVVQHVAADFLPALGRWLAESVPQPVRVVQHGDRTEPGTVHLAPGDKHLRLRPGGRLELSAYPSGLHVPSVDVLFESLAACDDARGVGVLLTGMGRDGARGLLALRQAGGRTLAQDETSSAVYGMPGAAVELGAAEQVLPLDELPEAVLALVARSPR
ncbi:MAG: chemotaxis response regulator protein-glutamate methylesterase [Frankiales bacterium]|nr:chemotaxis response regulator protein-glutamate methylesterase [Frankiales bacterium]